MFKTVLAVPECFFDLDISAHLAGRLLSAVLQCVFILVSFLGKMVLFFWVEHPRFWAKNAEMSTK